MGLSPKQEAFCLAYAKCGNATEAYKAAGYKPTSEKAAGNCGSRLLENVGIQNRLRQLQEKTAAPQIADAKEIQTLLTEAMRVSAQNGDTLGLCKTADILNKMHGAYVNKTELTGAEAGPLQFVWKAAKQDDADS